MQRYRDTLHCYTVHRDIHCHFLLQHVSHLCIEILATLRCSMFMTANTPQCCLGLWGFICLISGVHILCQRLLPMGYLHQTSAPVYLRMALAHRCPFLHSRHNRTSSFLENIHRIKGITLDKLAAHAEVIGAISGIWIDNRMVDYLNYI